MDVDVEAMLDAPYQEKRVSVLRISSGAKRAFYLIPFDRKNHMPLLTVTTETKNASKCIFLYDCML